MVARREYRDRLVQLEDLLLRTGDGYREQLQRAVTVVVGGRTSGTDEIVATDDALDRMAARVRDEAIELVALQSPVAGELRLLAAMLHVDIILERIGELAVNLSRSASRNDPDETEPVVQELGDLGAKVDRLIGRSLENFARRQPDHADLEALDDDIDHLRQHVHDRAVEAAMTDGTRADWAIRTALAASWLERGGDLGLGIARQVGYVVTGELAT